MKVRAVWYTGGLLPQVLRAGEWFLKSGIQDPDGGVARYYRLETGRNLAASTEITAYAASTFVFLGGDEMLERAQAAARYLMRAWHAESGAMPFEVDPAEFTYFFDCGIVVRGLLAVWRASGDESLLECACAVSDSMAQDFRGEAGDFHPVLSLPDKCPVDRDALRWSRSHGCYQLKAGMAWWELWEATGRPCYRERYEALREQSLQDAPEFLPGHSDPRKVVDRLHAFAYFLEGLLPMPCAALGDGIDRMAGLLRELAPEFERSDVYAQLLRVRLYADASGAVPLDRAAAHWEAERLLEFTAASDDPRIDGGFYFGRAGSQWEPYINPVSAAFALQALAIWNGDAEANRHLLI
jgi:hypothetical protein